MQAQQIAADLHHQAIEPAHLLLALIRQEDGIVPVIVTKTAGGVQALSVITARGTNGRNVRAVAVDTCMRPSGGLNAVPEVGEHGLKRES